MRDRRIPIGRAGNAPSRDLSVDARANDEGPARARAPQ
jgi:hypothetical protein